MKKPGYNRRASIVFVSPGATVVASAPPPCPVTEWKSTLCGWVFDAGLAIVKRRTSPTLARITGPGVPDTTPSSPPTIRYPQVSNSTPRTGSIVRTSSTTSNSTSTMAWFARVIGGGICGATATFTSVATDSWDLGQDGNHVAGHDTGTRRSQHLVDALGDDLVIDRVPAGSDHQCSNCQADGEKGADDPQHDERGEGVVGMGIGAGRAGSVRSVDRCKVCVISVLLQEPPRGSNQARRRAGSEPVPTPCGSDTPVPPDTARHASHNGP